MSKTAVITGGTKGIGKAIVREFASYGFDIITCSRTEEDLNKLKEEIESDFKKVKVTTYVVDMSDESSVKQFGQSIVAMDSSIDVLVNNAGVFIPGQIHTEEEGTLEKMINTNLYSAYHLTRSIIPTMKDRKEGHVFNICSTASIVPYINGGSYCISKYALLGFSKVLREEMKEFGVRVTSILPGATMSASWEGSDLPTDRFMKAEDVAKTIYNAYEMSDRTVIEEIVMRPQLGDI